MMDNQQQLSLGCCKLYSGKNLNILEFPYIFYRILLAKGAPTKIIKKQNVLEKFRLKNGKVSRIFFKIAVLKYFLDFYHCMYIVHLQK